MREARTVYEEGRRREGGGVMREDDRVKGVRVMVR
jgi:hypothetical protein